MGKLRDGARDLGLNIDWSYAFVPPGTRLSSTPNAVILDVGGELAMGVLDQHGDFGLGNSTSQLITRHPGMAYDHLMTAWLQRRDDGQDLRGRPFRPRVITHVDPDFDGVVSTHLLMRLIEDGDLPSYAEALAGYSATVDQGRYRLDIRDGDMDDAHLMTQLGPVHLAYLAVQKETVPSDVDQHVWRLRRGLELLEAELGGLTTAQKGELEAYHFQPGQPGVGSWRQDFRFAHLADELMRDWATHQEDWASAEHITRILPSRDLAHDIHVKGAILRQSCKAKLDRYWFRARGTPYTVIPRNPGQGGSESPAGQLRHSTVILSVDAAWTDPDGRRPSLRGLGERLEELEHAEREREPGGDTRGRTPRYEGVTNDDPWYDGRGHDYTIVDSPRRGTALPLNTILNVARSERFWETPIEGATLVVVERGGTRTGADAGKPVSPPDGVVEPLRAWFTDSRTQPGGTVEMGGFIGEVEYRTFPEDTCWPAVITTWRPPPHTRISLQELAKFVESLRRSDASGKSAPPCVMLAYRRPEGVSEDLLRTLEARVVGSQLEPLPGRPNVHIGVTGLAVRIAPRTSEPWRALCECFIYTSFLADTLTVYSDRIVRALGHSLEQTRASGAAATQASAESSAIRVQEKYIRFQARYYQLDVSHDPIVEDVFTRIFESRRLRDYHAEVSVELQRLADYETQRAQERLNRMVTALSLTGVAQTCMAFVQLDLYKDFHDPSMARSWLSLLLVVAPLVVTLVYLRRVTSST
jgi:hypothetical protein